MNTAYNNLILKLNKFIVRYYTNLIIKGALFSIGLIVLLFLAINVFEFLLWSSTTIRTVLFYVFVSLVVVIFVYYIVIPILKLIKLGKHLSHEDAAKIIGNHFPEVEDKLLNTLQLNSYKSDDNFELLTASIEQKSANISLVPFKNAINFKNNLKYLKYIIPLVVVVVALMLVVPSFLVNPTTRLINHNVHYSKPLPYSIKLLNTNFGCAQHNNFTVTVSVTGSQVPDKVFVNDGTFSYRMLPSKNNTLEYVFSDLMSNVYFTIQTHNFTSQKYQIDVFPVPIIYNFDVMLDYPNYLHKQNDKVENTGDLVVPQGTVISWKIYTRDTEKVSFITNDSSFLLFADGNNVFKQSLTAMQNFDYTLVAENEHMSNPDSMNFNVEVITDEIPQISVKEFKDELGLGMVNFTGTISDDHGFSSLKFYYRKDSNGKAKWKSETLLIDKNISQQYFTYMFNAFDLDINPGDKISYYFQVADNDGVNGYKRVKSQMFYFQLPDAAQIEELAESNSDAIKNILKESLNEIEDLNKQLEETRLNLFEKPDLSWLDKQQLNDLIKKEEKIRKQLNEIKKLNEDIKELQELLKKELSPELLEKLKELEEIMKKLADKDLDEELSKLKEDLKKDKVNDFLEKMKDQNQDLKDELEQNLEIYKQLEYEKLIEESINELKKLAEEQKELSEQTKNKENSKSDALKKQDDIEKKFDKAMEKLDEAQKLNDELEQPYEVKKDTALANEVNEEMEKASENIEKNKKNKASESQQKAGKKMKKMSEGLSAMMQNAMDARMGEDIEQLKNMLDNLLDLSFKQEQLINDLKIIEKNDPKNADIRDGQKQINDDFVIIHDSLIALSKRQVAIEAFVTKESGKVISHTDKVLYQLQEQQKGKAMANQQYAMTSINNLALMLAESIQKMKESMQMSGNSKGGKKCKNPGKGNKPSMSDIIKDQQGLNKGMKGKSKKDGLSGNGGLNGKSEELARMAAAQGEIRRMLQDLIEQIEAEGGSGSALNKLAEEMKKSEEDIINRRVSPETLERQKNIEVRLLKSQKAMQEREKEKKRESKEGKNKNNGNLNDKLEYNKKNDKKEDILITVPIEVRPYYRSLLKEYLYKLENDKNYE